MAVHPKIINKAVLHYLFPEVLFLHKIKIVNILLWKISLTKIGTAILSRNCFLLLIISQYPLSWYWHTKLLCILQLSYGIGITIFKSPSVFRYCICLYISQCPLFQHRHTPSFFVDGRYYMVLQLKKGSKSFEQIPFFCRFLYQQLAL